MVNLKQIQQQLCQSFCADIKIITTNGKTIIETPFSFDDGDLYQIYLEQLPMGGFRLTDGGHTLMHLSYENDIDSFKRGNRNLLLQNIKNELQIEENNGEFFVECTNEQIANSILKMGQALTKITDITFLNRSRVQKTFYEDLDIELTRILGHQKLQRDYSFEYFDNPENYLIDYNIKNNKQNSFNFIFGVPNKDKAQLVTIILERLRRVELEKGFDFNSLTIFENMHDIPQKTLSRLINIGDESVTTLQDTENLDRKVIKLVA